MLVEKQDLNSENTKKIEENPIVINLQLPNWVFTTTMNHTAMKFGTHIQVPNTNTPAKFQRPSHTITPVTPHMCNVRGQ